MTEFQTQVINLVNKDLSISEIAHELDRPLSSVSSVVKRFNLSPKKLYVNTVDENYFDIIDSDTKAYFLGFLIADGFISQSKLRSENRIGFVIQIDDKYILERLNEELHSSISLTVSHQTKGAKNRKPQVRLRWTSEHMIDTLINKYHIIPDKTHDSEFEFPFEVIPDQFKGSLIRGFIDGDGSFESHKGVFNPSIIGTSQKFLKQIGDLININTGLTYKIYEKVGKTCTYYTLRWSANRDNKVEKITKLYNYLYINDSISLKRKKDKIESYLEYRANQVRVNGIWQCNA